MKGSRIEPSVSRRGGIPATRDFLARTKHFTIAGIPSGSGGTAWVRRASPADSTATEFAPFCCGRPYGPATTKGYNICCTAAFRACACRPARANRFRWIASTCEMLRLCQEIPSRGDLWPPMQVLLAITQFLLLVAILQSLPTI